MNSPLSQSPVDSQSHSKWWGCQRIVLQTEPAPPTVIFPDSFRIVNILPPTIFGCLFVHGLIVDEAEQQVPYLVFSIEMACRGVVHRLASIVARSRREMEYRSVFSVVLALSRIIALYP